jgi:rod shape-determining protein MreC
MLSLGSVLLLDSWGYLQGPKNAAISVLAPVQSSVMSSSNGISDFFYTLGKIDEFKDENKRLEEENGSLNYELTQLKEVKRENELFREQLKFKENLCAGSDCADFIMGKVIARNSDGYGQSITINLGTEDGVKANQAVTVSGGVVVGKVVEAYEGHSKVALIVSPESAVNCLTQTTRANGLVKGAYGMAASLEMIDQSEELLPGDVIITSGLEEGVPKGLLVGKISRIEESPNMVFKSASLELYADFAHVEEIFIVVQK